jgi:hypothetical protein
LQFVLDWDNYIFPFQKCCLVDRLRVKSSCIQVNMVYMEVLWGVVRVIVTVPTYIDIF